MPLKDRDSLHITGILLTVGLRATALLLPLSFALWLPKHFRPRAVTVNMVTGTVAMLMAGLLKFPTDSMYYGLLASAIILLPTIKKQ